ncbi:MAG: YeiH family protein [Paraprevotella sp.]|nr:YeiH family protein [Paraprevotella sp.]
MFNEQRSNVIHGVLLIMGFSFAAFYIADFAWVKQLSFSPLIVGILIGILYANSLRNHLPETWVPGIKLCTKQILRTGIVLYGFKLTLQDVAAVGPAALFVDTIIVCGTIGLGLLLARLLKIDGETALMTSTGSAICGAAAVLGAEPVVRCPAHKTAVAVSTVVIFGTLSMFVYPILFRSGALYALDNMGVAIYTGSTLHEVAHVVGAGNAMDPDGLLGISNNATIVKMIRVMMLAPVLVIMSFVLSRLRKGTPSGGQARKNRITIPWFAFGFLAVILLNSALIHLLRDGGESLQAGYAEFRANVSGLDTFLLTMAMTALGAETSMDKFKQAGAKPFVLAGLLYLWLLLGGFLLCKYLVPLL